MQKRREPMTQARKQLFVTALADGLSFRAAAGRASALASARGGDNSFRLAMKRDPMFARRVAGARR